MAEYSKTPLIKKLGIKAGETIVLLDEPDNYVKTLGMLPEKVEVKTKLEANENFIQFFTKDKKVLIKQFPVLKKALALNGILWISWPKKSAKIPTGLNENVIREIGLKNGLVDVKVAAIDNVWSGLKFVYRLKDR